MEKDVVTYTWTQTILDTLPVVPRDLLTMLVRCLLCFTQQQGGWKKLCKSNLLFASKKTKHMEIISRGSSTASG